MSWFVDVRELTIIQFRVPFVVLLLTRVRAVRGNEFVDSIWRLTNLRFHLAGQVFGKFLQKFHNVASGNGVTFHILSTGMRKQTLEDDRGKFRLCNSNLLMLAITVCRSTDSEFSSTSSTWFITSRISDLISAVISFVTSLTYALMSSASLQLLERNFRGRFSSISCWELC